VTRKGSEKGRCPLCRKDEDDIHILLKCSETSKWREKFLIENGLLLSCRNIFHSFNCDIGNRTLFQNYCLLGCFTDGTITLMMNSIGNSATPVNFYQTTCHNIPEESQRYTLGRENLKFHTHPRAWLYVFLTGSLCCRCVSFVHTDTRGRTAQSKQAKHDTWSYEVLSEGVAKIDSTSYDIKSCMRPVVKV
jgi:hypothetical protein